MKKKIFVSIIAASLALGQLAVFAEQDVQAPANDILISAPEEKESNEFITKSGTIKSVEADMYIAEGENAEEFWIEKTALVTDEKGEAYTLKAGDKFTLFVSTRTPMLLSLPERYAADLVVVQNSEDAGLPDVDMYFKSGEDDFGDYINASNKLALNISEDTKIVDKNGNAYKGSLDSKELAVFYSMMAMSLPAQTSPDKVIVLNADLGSVSVNGKRLVFEPCKTDVSLLPLRAICESLGYDVEWDGALQCIRVGVSYTMQIGKNAYIKGKAMPETLKCAPVLEDGVTYVPAEYFSEILELTVSEDGKTISEPQVTEEAIN